MAVEKSIAQLMTEAPVEAEVEIETISEDQLPLFESNDTVMLEDGSAIVGYVEDENELSGDFYANLAEELSLIHI